MKNISVLQEKRKGRNKFDESGLAAYSTMNFGMFGGEERNVKIEFKNEMVGVIIDRFGKNIMIHPSEKDGWSHTTVKVAISRHFFGWIFALGTDVVIVITGPIDVVKMFEREIDERKKQIKCRE